jgi:hypothetical protein
VSTDIPFNIDSITGDAFPPDPETISDLEIDPLNDDNIPAVVPIFDDALFDDVPVESYDEYGNVLSVLADSPPEVVPIGRTWAFDFEKGDFEMAEGGTPLKISNNDTRIIQQWIRRALTTERLAYLIYPANFGVELAPVMNHSVRGAAAMAHVSTTVKDALLFHDRITEVSNLVVTEESGTIFVRANVQLDRGELIAVNVPVGGV